MTLICNSEHLSTHLFVLTWLHKRKPRWWKGELDHRWTTKPQSHWSSKNSTHHETALKASLVITLSLLDTFSWPLAFVSLAFIALLVCLMAPMLAGRAEPVLGTEQSLTSALSQALGHRGFLLLVTGFFVCGFQLAFIGIHLPAYLLDRQLDVWLGGAALATIGAANIVGTFACGALGDRVSKKKVLAVLYLIRAGVVAGFVILPPSAVTTLVFAVIIGLTWLGTVPLTSGIVAQIFGPRYLSTLVGVVFLMHQLGSFLGAWLGGLAFERTGSYDLVWWCVVLTGIAAALLHWPIDERPIADETDPSPVAVPNG